jgi:hypothetical protein
MRFGSCGSTTSARPVVKSRAVFFCLLIADFDVPPVGRVTVCDPEIAFAKSDRPSLVALEISRTLGSISVPTSFLGSSFKACWICLTIFCGGRFFFGELQLRCGLISFALLQGSAINRLVARRILLLPPFPESEAERMQVLD